MRNFTQIHWHFVEFHCPIVLQDTETIRHYQKLTDIFVNFWDRGYRTDDLRMYLDGYLAALRQANALEYHLIHRLEEDATRFLYDRSNFETPMPQPESDYGYY